VDAGTRGAYLGAVERLYSAVTEQANADVLDRLLTDARFDDLEDALGGFLAKLCNESAITGENREQTWRIALRFIEDILNHVAKSNSDSMSEAVLRLERLNQLYSQIWPTPPRTPPPIRALPVVVLPHQQA
jgi:hypothetical protein